MAFENHSIVAQFLFHRKTYTRVHVGCNVSCISY